MDLMSFQQVIILVFVGIIAGGINTLAGGGSNLTLPALMMFGLPADIANATNRVSVLMQSLTATRGFYLHKKIDSSLVKDTFIPLLVGGLIGAITASYLDVALLKPILLGTMIIVALWVVIRSDNVKNSHLVLKSCYDTKWGFISTLLAGFYGGFIQAGVGFVLIAAFVGVLNYDLLRANAMKVAATVIFTSIALLIFILRNQIAWLPGLMVAVGSMIGAQVVVNVSINIKAQTLKILVLAMTIIAGVAALFFN